MADDLKNSLKQLEDYVQQEKKLKVQEQKKLNQELKVAAFRQQWTFPLNKLLFLSGALSAIFYFYGQTLTPMILKLAPKPVADQYSEVVKLIQETTQKVEAVRAAARPPASPEAAIGEAPQGSQNGDNNPRAVAGTEASKAPEWVQIDRKWYPKSPDNIYMINGKKVLFIENRRRDEPAPKPAMDPE